MSETTREKLTALLEPLVEENGYELVDLEYKKESGRWVLRLFIDRPEGITLDDCEYVSQRVGDYLDVADPIPHSYLLEVSSPGINRVLKKDKDFVRFRGRTVSIRTFAPIEGRRLFRGYLEGLEADHVLVREGENILRIPRDSIAKARLEAE